jgi:hypothetical protein
MLHANGVIGILLVLMCGAILYYILSARSGRDVFIRRIPGLNAIDEAVGRAAELGRPVLFCPGISPLDIDQFCALAVLTYVIRVAARFGVRVITVIFAPQVYPIAEEVVRQAYETEGKPEMFAPNDVRFLSDSQSAFAMSVSGIIVRDEAAACFYFGNYGFEALILAETGQRAGAVQVASPAAVSIFQIPFFIASCDYVIIGEEFYAASAYLSRDPTMLGSLVGQDRGKILLLALIVIGVIFATMQGQIYSWFWQKVFGMYS